MNAMKRGLVSKITFPQTTRCSLTCSIDCGVSNGPVLLEAACQMLRCPPFVQGVLPSPFVAKARKCHHMRRRRCSYRFQKPYAR